MYLWSRDRWLPRTRLLVVWFAFIHHVNKLSRKQLSFRFILDYYLSFAMIILIINVNCWRLIIRRKLQIDNQWTQHDRQMDHTEAIWTNDNSFRIMVWSVNWHMKLSLLMSCGVWWFLVSSGYPVKNKMTSDIAFWHVLTIDI